MKQRFELDRWTGKTIERPDFVEEARANCDKICEVANNAEPFLRFLTGVSDGYWNLHFDRVTPVTPYIPKTAQWLKENNAEVLYWLVHEIGQKSPDFKEEHERWRPTPLGLGDSLPIHSDNPMPAEEKVKFDNDEVLRNTKPDVKISLNIPMDDNDGMTAMRVYNYGNPPATQYQLGPVTEEHPKGEIMPFKEGSADPREDSETGTFTWHGFFMKDEVEMVYEELEVGNKPVLLNSWQPHSWHKNKKNPVKRLILRLCVDRNGSNAYPDDPWNLFDLDK